MCACVSLRLYALYASDAKGRYAWPKNIYIYESVSPATRLQSSVTSNIYTVYCIFSIQTIRHHLYTFTTQGTVSSLIEKDHSSHLARIQLRDMALKARPPTLPIPHKRSTLH